MAKLLIVDDHSSNRAFLVTLLRYQGHDLVEASDGREALAIAAAERPDLILSDILMPSMDGYEFVRELRADPALARTPVIFTTAHYLSRQAAALAASCGVVHILHKPMEPELVLATTAAVLGGGAAPSPSSTPAVALDGFDRQHLRLLSEQLVAKNQALEAVNQRLERLVQIGLDLGNERDLSRLIDAAAQAARTLIGARFAVAGLLERPGAAVRGTVAGWPHRTEGRDGAIRPAILADRLAGGGIVNLHGLRGAPIDLGLPAGFPEVDALLATPIRTPARTYGWIALTDKLGTAHFTAEDETVMRILGSQIGVLVENLLLFEETRRAEARHRAVVETAVDAIVVIDDSGIVHSFNRAAESMFGWDASEIVGAKVNRLMTAAHDAAHDGYLQHYRRTGEHRIIGGRRELPARRRDGTVFPIDLGVAEWRDGDQRYFTALLRDITERKETERQIRQARDAALAAQAEAERANVGKSRFLAAASHDLRQPAQSMVLFANVLANQLQDHPARPALLGMEQALEALTLLLGRLLDVSKLDAGMVQPVFQDVALGDLLARLEAEYGPRADVEGLRLRVVRSRAVVRTDATLLEQVLRNILENALRHTQQGGILIGCRRKNGAIHVDVVDTGRGIPAEQLETIFEEFYQIDNPERDRNKGLGLGLAIVRRLAGLLGHAVAVTSRPGHGSCFSVGLTRPTRTHNPPNDGGAATSSWH